MVSVQFQTSYFGALKKLPLSRCLSICRGVPAYYKGKRCMSLAPSRELLNAGKEKLISPSEWKRRYIQEIERNVVLEDLLKEIDGRILLCWERPGDRCHRNYVADWLAGKGVSVVASEFIAESSNVQDALPLG